MSKVPNGIGIFQIPQDLSREFTFEDDSITDPKKRAEIFGQYDHVRVYGRDYFDKLRKIGFNVNALDYTKKLTKKRAFERPRPSESRRLSWPIQV